MLCCSVPRVLKFQFIRFTNQVSAQRWERKLTDLNAAGSAQWESVYKTNLIPQQSFPFDFSLMHNCTLLKLILSGDAAHWCSLSSSCVASELWKELFLPEACKSFKITSTLYFKILILDYRTSSQTPNIMDERLWTLSPDAHSMCNIFKSVHFPVLKLSYSVCFCSHFPSSLSRSHWVFRAVRNPTTLLKWSEAAAQLSGQTAMQVKGRLQPHGQVS